MPYITKLDRSHVDPHLNNFLSYVDIANSPGRLNYIITAICHDYLQRSDFKYKDLNEVLGVLESAKLELYRQVVAKYEDKKREENGSISGLDK